MAQPARHEELRPDTLAFHRALAELVRVYQFRDRERICCHDVSVTQCYALEALIGGGAQTLNALAAALYLDKSTASRVVDALEAKGYASRRPHPASGRAVLVDVTTRGRDLHARIERDILVEEQRLLDEFPPAVRARMAELLHALGQAASRRTQTACCANPPDASE